jgi:hypothetical protein
MFLATLQQTAVILWSAPTPMMLEETTWVVETGPPTKAAAKIQDHFCRGRMANNKIESSMKNLLELTTYGGSL